MAARLTSALAPIAAICERLILGAYSRSANVRHAGKRTSILVQNTFRPTNTVLLRN